LLEQRFAQAEGGAATSAQLADYQRAAGTLRRLLTSLGLQRRGRDVGPIGPRYIGLRLACSKALERFLALMGRHLARASEANAALLGSLAALAGPGGPRAENAANFFNAGGNARPSLTNATLAASRLLHRRSPSSREPADRGGVDGIGPRYIGLLSIPREAGQPDAG